MQLAKEIDQENEPQPRIIQFSNLSRKRNSKYEIYSHRLSKNNSPIQGTSN